MGRILFIIIILATSCAHNERKIASKSELNYKEPWFMKSKLFYKRFIAFNKSVDEDFIETYKELRLNAPVLSLGKIPMLLPKMKNKGTYLITRSENIVEAFNRPEKFSVKLYAKKMDRSVKKPHMLSRDNTDYNKEKRWIKHLMPDSDWDRIKNMTQLFVKDSIQKHSVSKKDFREIEVVNNIARKTAVNFVYEYIGFKGTSLKTMYRWSAISQKNFFHNVFNNPITKLKSKKASAEMLNHTKTLVTRRIREIQKDIKQSNNINYKDIISRMIHYKLRSKRDIPLERITVNIVGMVMAAIETTQSATVNALDFILSNEKIKRLSMQTINQEDFETLKKIVLESLRFQPQTAMVLRYAEEDYTFNEGTSSKKVVPKGNIIMLSTQSAMFDESYFESPNDFKLDRDSEKYMHFGYGHHRCLGDKVSEVMVTAIVSEILKLPNINKAKGKKGKINKKGGPFPESFHLTFEN